MAAARGSHVQTLEAQHVERRLRPIYDLLDCGSNKKALQEVEKVLKKWPTLQCARALKSLATLRLGRVKDSLSLVEALAADLPTDDATLLVMAIVYRETHQMDKVCRMYEAAVKKEPTSEELHTHLFMAHVRAFDLERQHHTAMALYRFKSKNPYYFWGVMSVVLQATKGVGSTDPIKRNVFLALAQRMVDKFINENKLEAEQEVQLYVMILQLQNKHSEALEFLEGPLGRKLMPGALPQASLPFLVKLERWHRLNLQCKELIWDNPDRWDFYLPYFESAFKLMATSESTAPTAETNCNAANKCGRNGTLEHVDDTSEKCHEFLSQIIENAAEKKQTLRGPYLARLELYKRLREEDRNPTDLMGNAADLLVDYFRMFGHKACSVNDLRPYLSLVVENEREQLAQRFTDTVGISAVFLPQNDEQMQRHICSLQLSRICGRQALLAEEQASMLAGILALHCERAALCPPLSSTERTPYDPYSLLAAHLCYDLALKCQSSKPLVEALYLLEYVLKNSPSNFHIKLLCIKFYHMLGCGSGALSIYESLDVKHMQVDSLGYIHMAQLGCTGLYAEASSAYETALKFFAHTYKDSVDYITFAYKYGSFMKLEELMDFRELIHGSLVRVYVLVEKAMLSVVSGSTHQSVVKALSQVALNSPANVVIWDKLRDNRDLGVFANWDPLTVVDPSAASKTFHQDEAYARLKYILLESLIHCANISACAVDKADFDLQRELGALQSSIDAFDELFRRSEAEKLECVNRISVSSPIPSRIVNFVNSPMPFKELYRRAFTIVIMYSKGDFEPALKSVDECGVHVDKFIRHTSSVLDEQINAADPLWTCKRALEDTVNAIEAISIVAVAVGVCSDLVKQANSKKGKKKGGGGASVIQLDGGAPAEPINLLVEHLIRFVDTLSQKLNLWSLPNIVKDLSDHFSNLSVVIGDTNVVTNKLKEGHVASLQSLKQTLKDKHKYLSGLAC